MLNRVYKYFSDRADRKRERLDVVMRADWHKLNNAMKSAAIASGMVYSEVAKSVYGGKRNV